MSQQKLPFKKLNKHFRLALVILSNFAAPSLGNLIFIGFNMVNIFSAALSFWIWSKHSQLLLYVWLFLLAARAFGDIYLHKKDKPHGSTHTSHKQPHELPHAIPQHDLGSVSSYNPQSDHPSHSNYHPPDAGPAPQKHAPPQQAAQQAAHPNTPSNPASHKPGWDPKFHLHENKEDEPAALKPLNKLESHDASHSEAHAHRSIVHPTDPLVHGEAAAQSGAQEQNNDQQPHILEADNHNRHLSHAELPIALHESAPHRPADSADDGGVVFDIYGEDEDEETDSAMALSPIKDGFFHDVHAAEPAKDQAGSTAVPDAENTREHSSQQLRAAMDEEFSIPIDHHKKRIQVCSNCQRPREHHRPKCPTCGTLFED